MPRIMNICQVSVNWLCQTGNQADPRQTHHYSDDFQEAEPVLHLKIISSQHAISKDQKQNMRLPRRKLGRKQGSMQSQKTGKSD